jgi:hypothetical protein
MNGEIETTMAKYVDPITSTHGANSGKFSCCPFGSSNPLGLLAILAYFVVLLHPATLEAQSGAGSIQGTVRDATKAVIPNATIVVINTATGVQQSTVTNGIGFYSVPSLFAGPYTVTARAANMDEWKTSLTLEVGQAATIDATLAVGTSTQVTVVGDQTSLITYNNQTVATDLERQRIEQLPLNGRVLSSLVVESTPGVEGSAQAVDVNGTVENAQEYVLDGAVISNMDSGGITLRQPDPDSIQEVRIETSASSAKYDLPSTTILTTRSGTNQYHGSFFETNRNNSFGIARTRANGTNYVAPKLIRNEFGGSVGGPIRIPHFYNGHDKAFFFIAWEDEEFRGDDLQALSVPTLAMRQGNFGGLTTSGGQRFTIYDPSTTQANGTRSPFNYGGPPTCTAAATATCTNTINPTEISPLAKYLYSISPLPTLPTVNPYIAPNFTGTTPHYIHAPTFSGRGDYRLNEHNSFYVRGSETFYQIHDLNETIYGPPTTDGVANITEQPTNTYSGALGWSHIFSPTFFSEFVISQNWETDKVATGPDPTHDYDAQFGLPDPFNVLGYPDIEGQATGNGQTSILEDYVTADNTRSDTTQILQIDENLTKVLGKHQLTFGGRYRRDHIDVVPDEFPNGSTVQYDSYGTAQFNTATAASGAYTAVTNTGLAAADFFIGNADAYTTAKLHIPFQFVNQEVAGYMQDDWHVRSNLTLNLGLRYEAHPTPREVNNSVPSFDFNTQSIVLGEPISQLISTGQTTQAILNSFKNAGVKFETTQAAGLPNRMVYSNDLNFAPRVGAAWRIFGDRRSTVFRGGFGSYLYPVPVRNFYFSTYTDPPYTASLTDDLTSSSQAGTDGLPNYILRSKPTLVTGSNTANLISASGNPVINNASIGQSFLDPHSPVSVVKNGNVTLEQQLKDNLVVRVSYVVSQANHLEQNWNYNTAPPAYVQYVNTDAPRCTATNCANIISPVYGSILEQRRTGYSTDNSGQINLQRTYSKGYAYQVFYVFSSAFRNGGNAFRDSIVYPLQDYANGTAPASLNAENREANYLRNTGIPVHRIRWNFVVDLPIGRGKKYFANMPRWLDEVVGGFQIAGDGTVHSQEFALTATNYGPTAPLVIYKHAHPILDCRSGICYKGYQYFNGFISPTQINAPNGVTGLDTANQPYQCPVDTRPTVTSGPACGQPIPSGVTVTNPNFNTNDVVGGIPLSNGTIAQNVAVEPGPSDYGNPYVRKIIQGPFIFNEDLSIFKVFPIRGRVNFKVNLDAFNVFNNQGDASPDATTGLQEFTTSVNGARQLQISGRLSF